MHPHEARPSDAPRDATSTSRGARVATPNIDSVLASVRARVTSNVCLHGLGTAAAFGAAWLALAFVLDAWLHLPGPIRVLHALVTVAVPVFFLWRELARPLARRPDRAGLAVLVERAHPELDQVLVSAVQLSDSPAPSGDPALVARVVSEAESRAAGLSLERVLDPRGPRRRALGGTVAVAALLAAFAWNAATARTFFARFLGADVPWPQRTQLHVEVATGATDGASLTAPDPRADVHAKVARGSDVPVLVRADGDIPDEVVLHFDDGHKAVLAAGAGREFRTVLRSLQSDVSFFATGGDDQDGLPRVFLNVLQPPDVSGLALEIQPPAYSGLPTRVEFDRDVEVLAGTKLVVHVRTSPPEATGRARLLPEDRVLPLAPLPFPVADARPDAAPASAAAEARPGEYGFEIVPTKSLRYRFELSDSTGLSNPDPGLFGVTVIEDRAPEVEVIAPGRGDFDTVAGGAVPLAARAEDDFGIARLAYVVETAGESGEGVRAPAVDLPFAAVALEARGETADPSRVSKARVARAAVFGRTRLEVSALAPGEASTEGRTFQIQVVASDVTAPTPREGRSAPVRVRVVSTDEFLRRLQDRLARAQTSASALAELVREKHRRTLELIAVLESDDPAGANGEVASVLTGQRRVTGDARALARELCGGAESVLYARVDERAGAALDQLDAALSRSTSRAFDPAPWRELAAASRDRSAAGAGLAGKLVDIAGLALEISEDSAQRATEELAAAAGAVGLEAVHEHLLKGADLQKQTLERIDRLLERLAEWDNFQSVLTLTRDILNGQKNIRERTRDAARETK